MIKTKIFLYELKRTVLTKVYAFLIILTLAYSVYCLKTSVMRGFADTAPFSEWSFMSYLFSITPVLSAILLFYVSRLFSPYEKNVMCLTSSSPFSGPVFFGIKIAVALLTYTFAALVAILACFVFYSTVFGFYNYSMFLICMALVLIPEVLFISGIGLLVSRLHHNLAFVLIGLVFFLSNTKFTLPYFFDVLGNSIMQIPTSSTPLAGYIPFNIPVGFTLSRAVLSLIGLALLLAGCLRYKSLKV